MGLSRIATAKPTILPQAAYHQTIHAVSQVSEHSQPWLGLLLEGVCAPQLQ